MENLQLKRYTIKEKTGEGGMADVYLAYDNVLKRECAIKIMKLELSSDPIARIRFRREADAAATLQHPNIVTIYDVGESNNRPFIVMEFVRGLTLKSLIQQRGAIEKREAIFIATQICEGLQAAHEAGVIHRDVKPHNILIKADSTAKITDFGIASVQGAIQLTQHDSVMGSVHYLAPECSRGEAASVQSDIYSLGIVLYEMLTGDLPFKGDAAVQVAMKHMQEDIPSIRAKNNSIEQSIENIIIKATSKNKLTRYQNADEMLVDLKNCLKPEHAHDPKVNLAPVTPIQQEHTRVFSDIVPNTNTNQGMSNRNKILIGVIAAAALGLLILLATSLLGNNQPPTPETFALIDVTDRPMEEAKAQLEAQELIVNPTILYETHDTIEKDRVIRTDPEANTQVEKEQNIQLIVSLGKAFVVENYVGRDIQEVRDLLADIDFINLSVEYEETNEVSDNTIISQEGLTEGEQLDPNREYNLLLKVARPKVFQIPDLRGQNYLEAQAELESLGATVELSPQDSSTLSDELWEQTTFEVITKMTPSQNSSFTPNDDNKITLEYWTKTDRTIVKTDKTELINRITEAREIDTSNMTQESVFSLNLAIQNAQSVLDNPTASQESVNTALKNINDAINLLKTIEVRPTNPDPNPVMAGDTVITGTADPSVTIRITNNQNQEIGLGNTNDDGTFEINIVPQEADTAIFVTASNLDGLTSDPIPVIVTAAPQQ